MASLNNKAKARATLADVARECGLDKSTVSRVLNLPPEDYPVSAQTRQRIMECVERLRYKPNWQARALATGETRAIGLCFSASRWLTRPMLSAEISLAEESRKQGYHLQFFPLADAPDEWDELLQARRVDGFVVLNSAPVAFCQRLAELGVPAVTVNFDAGAALDGVFLDDEMGARLATKTLIDLGHREIVFLHWDFDNRGVRHPSMSIRQEAFASTMLEAGLSPRVACYSRPLESAASQLLAGGPATAALCYSHRDAAYLLNGLWRLGLRVPDEFSVIAFNDVFPAECTIPPLTVVCTMEERMGTVGGRMLLESIRGEAGGEPRRIVLPETLIMRESAARAPDEARLIALSRNG